MAPEDTMPSSGLSTERTLEERLLKAHLDGRENRMRRKREGRKEGRNEHERGQRKQAALSGSHASGWRFDKVTLDQRSAPQGLFTFTISCARIPPTTAHTGAISEKQYLQEKTKKMEP